MSNLWSTIVTKLTGTTTTTDATAAPARRATFEGLEGRTMLSGTTWANPIPLVEVAPAPAQEAPVLHAASPLIGAYKGSAKAMGQSFPITIKVIKATTASLSGTFASAVFGSLSVSGRVSGTKVTFSWTQQGIRGNATGTIVAGKFAGAFKIVANGMAIPGTFTLKK